MKVEPRPTSLRTVTMPLSRSMFVRTMSIPTPRPETSESVFAVENATRTAAPNERFIAGDVAEHLSSVLAPATPATTTLLLDPPATGLDSTVVAHILASSPASIIYISCNPATLARDLAALVPTYQLKSVTPIDMFPQTAEVEVVVELVCSGNV